TTGSGNVFADLGLENPWGRLAKAQLAAEITNVIKSRGLTQAEAATILGVDQPKISMITRGNLSSFTLDRLVRFLYAFGKEVRVEVSDRSSEDDQSEGSVAQRETATAGV
ncbi:MAG: helix-turn-helix domain-containing protein, partial [Armatimonadota bacterium]|nr:helix-turn-helix domain-containing protein [Armatimonadota bacterium]